MNDTLNTVECPHCHGIVDQFGKIYLCRNCRAEGRSLKAFQRDTEHWLLRSNTCNTNDRVKEARAYLLEDPMNYIRVCAEEAEKDEVWRRAPWWKRLWYCLTWD